MIKILKQVWILLAFFVVQSSFAATPDILVYSRTQSDWNVFLLEEFRVFMNNLDIEGVDPKQITLSDPILYSNDDIREYVTNDLHGILNQVGDIIGLRYANIKAELVVNEFGYSVRKILPKIKPIEGRDGNVTLKSTIALEGLEASAKDLSIQFTIEGLTKKPRIKIKNPTIILRRGTRVDFDLDVKFVEQNNKMKLELREGNFSRLTQMLTDDHEIIDIIFDEEEIEFPEIRGSFGGRELELNHRKIIDMILENKNQLKILLFDQLHELFKRNIADEILKKFDNVSFKTDRWIEPTSESVFPVYLKLEGFSVPFKDTFMAEISGDFCTTVNYVNLGDRCIDNRDTLEPVDSRTESDLISSKKLIKEAFHSRENIKFLTSVSEAYINRSIVTTIDFGIWEPITEQMGITLGDKGVLLKLDETGRNGTLLLDVVYKLTGLQGFFLGEKTARFPVILKVTARVEDGVIDGEKNAQVVFNVHDVDLNQDYLRNGHAEYGFPSNIKDMSRLFRKKVVKLIKKELIDYDAPTATDRLKDWKGLDLPPIVLPHINNMHLDKMHVESDGLGRLNIVLEGETPIFRRTRSRRL